MRKRILVPACVLLTAAAWTFAAAVKASDPAPKAQAPAKASTPLSEMRIEVPPPPFTDGIFPCSSCHNKEMPANPKRRVLADFHNEIELKHDEEHRWCLDCHDANNRDQLHLASGDPVPFSESYRLCGQCHGEKYRDWRAGVHGRRVGEWNGHKKYLLCAHCHNPHQPHFKAIAPKPAPLPPSRPGSAEAPAAGARRRSEPPRSGGAERQRVGVGPHAQ